MCSWPATSEYLVSANDYDEFISWELIYLTIEAYLRRTSVAARGHSWASWAQLRRPGRPRRLVLERFWRVGLVCSSPSGLCCAYGGDRPRSFCALRFF